MLIQFSFHLMVVTSTGNCYNVTAEMRKQRKMGHITIVGPSIGTLEARLNSMLKEDSCDCPSVGNLLFWCLSTCIKSYWIKYYDDLSVNAIVKPFL